jgi:hypothetical protein
VGDGSVFFVLLTHKVDGGPPVLNPASANIEMAVCATRVPAIQREVPNSPRLDLSKGLAPALSQPARRAVPVEDCEGQRPVEWCISVSSSTSVFMLGGLEFERDVLLEIEDGRAVHGEVAAV